MNFLPVGHTHEDIDQLFSKISDEITKTGCESIPGKYFFMCISILLCTIHVLMYGFVILDQKYQNPYNI